MWIRYLHLLLPPPNARAAVRVLEGLSQRLQNSVRQSLRTA